MNLRTRELMHRHSGAIWQFPSARRLTELTKTEGLLSRFFRVSPRGYCTVTVVPPIEAATFHALTPYQRTALLKKLIAEALDPWPALFGDWEYRVNGQPHFHALTSVEGAEALAETYPDTELGLVDVYRGGVTGWVRYMLKPRHAARVKAAIRLLDAGCEEDGLDIMHILQEDYRQDREAVRSRDGKRKMPNRLHSHGVPEAFRPLSDKEWERVHPVMPRQGSRGRPRHSDRAILNALLWRQHYHHAPWRSLPDVYPPWGTCARRVSEWAQLGILDAIRPLLPPRMLRTFKTEMAGNIRGDLDAA